MKVKNRVKVFHVKDNKRAMTIATEVSLDGEYLKFGFAFCSKKDQFNKKLGRSIAMGRMNTSPRQVAFSGHSANDIINIFNDSCVVNKPSLWRKGKLLNIEHFGLSFVEKV